LEEGSQYDLLTLWPRLSKIIDSKHFVFDLRKLDSGKYSFPYHFHRLDYHKGEENIQLIWERLKGILKNCRKILTFIYLNISISISNN
jgi:hypothetical protein